MSNIFRGRVCLSAKLEFRPTFTSKSRKTKVLCFFCRNRTSPKMIITCSCARRPENEDIFYACQECLVAGRTCPPPPTCPAQNCNGKCLIKNIGIDKSCSICQAIIPAYTKAWFCTATTCKPPRMRCIQCKSPAALCDAIPPPPPTPAYSSLADPNLGHPAPMPGTTHAGRC